MNEPINQFALANELRSQRLRRNWSLREAAERLFISHAMLGQMELGDRSPSRKMVKKISAGYGLSYDYVESLVPHRALTIDPYPSLELRRACIGLAHRRLYKELFEIRPCDTNLAKIVQYAHKLDI